MGREQIGNHVKFFYLLLCFIFFILIGNFNLNIPYSFAVTASGVVSLGLSITIFIGVTF